MSSTKNFRQYFSRYTPDERTAPVADAARDIRVRADKENKIIEIDASFDRLFPRETLYAVEDGLCKAYSLNLVRLLPKYPAELFSHDYLSEIITELYRVGSVSRGFFERYDAVWDDAAGKLTLEVCYGDGGVNLLCGAKTNEIIAGIIRSEFGLEYAVEIRTSDNLTDGWIEMQMRQEEERILPWRICECVPILVLRLLVLHVVLQLS
jgi:DNA polymerase-3 subunit alpha (Gram-positive type)